MIKHPTAGWQLFLVNVGGERVNDFVIAQSQLTHLKNVVVVLNDKWNCFPSGDDHQYELTYDSQNEKSSELYDIVVIATPLQQNVNSGISFQGFEPQLPEMPGSYHQTVASIIHGYLNCTYFGFPDPKLFPFSSILTTDTPGLFFNSAASVCPVNITSGFRRKQPQEAGVYKVFSPKPLEKNELKTLFKSYYSVQVTDWLAYPHYGSTQGLPQVVLHDNLYFLNGIEWAGSAMEMSSVAAKNIALLAYHRWNRQLEMIDQKDLMHKVKTELWHSVWHFKDTMEYNKEVLYLQPGFGSTRHGLCLSFTFLMQNAKTVACLLACQMFGEHEQHCGLRLNAWSLSGGGNVWDVFYITDQLQASASSLFISWCDKANTSCGEIWK